MSWRYLFERECSSVALFVQRKAFVFVIVTITMSLGEFFLVIYFCIRRILVSFFKHECFEDYPNKLQFKIGL